MISNFEIEDVMLHYKIPYQGSFMSPELPKKCERKSIYIVNLDNREASNGTHWVMVLSDKKDCFYFDSFACPPNNETNKFIKSTFKQYGYNNKIIQNIESDFCGLYCIALAIYFVKHYNADLFKTCDKFLDHFADDSALNDNILKHFYTKNKNISQIIREKLKKGKLL